MDWRPLPPPSVVTRPIQWVGHENGEDVAWITEGGRHWGEAGHRWTVATRHGTAFGWRRTLEDAIRTAEQVLHEHSTGHARAE